MRRCGPVSIRSNHEAGKNSCLCGGGFIGRCDPHDQFLSRTWSYFFSDFKRLRKTFFSHVSSQLLHLLSAVTPVNNLKKFSVTLDKKYRDDVKKLFPKNQVYIGLLIGAGQPERRWPIENFIQVAQNRLRKIVFPFLFLALRRLYGGKHCAKKFQKRFFLCRNTLT